MVLVGFGNLIFQFWSVQTVGQPFVKEAVLAQTAKRVIVRRLNGSNGDDSVHLLEVLFVQNFCVTNLIRIT